MYDKHLTFGNTPIAKMSIFDIYAFSPSNLLVFFLFFIEKTRAKKNNIKTEANKKKVKFFDKKRTLVDTSKLIKLIFLVATFIFITKISTFFLFYFVDDDGKFKFIPILISGSIFYIFTTSLLSRFFLSSYFYRHHFVSLVLNIICLIINAIIEIRYLKNVYNIIQYIINVVIAISYSFASIFQKYLLKYLTPYAAMFYTGSVQILYLVILFIPLYFIERNGENIFANFREMFDGYKIILLNIAYFIIFGSHNLITLIVIDKFSPNDYGLLMMIQTMIDKSYEYASKPETFTDNIFISICQIIIFIFLIIGICIHNEIIVINKWGLNEYTKNNIAKKGDEDFIDIDVLDENINGTFYDDGDYTAEMVNL